MNKQSSKQKTLFQAWHKEPNANVRKKNKNGKLSTAQDTVEMASDHIDLTDDDLIEAAEMLESTMDDVPGTSGISNREIEDIPGFDNSLGHIYIYPTNYPVRDYQFSIVRNALFKNTLVSLPTGLGKTFIAAVVMYNFYRWYPQGKIVFMAPTKPLVSQQIEACYKIMGIPLEDQAEITGMTTSVHKREALWSSKRVFFLTPQVINNDLARGVCPANQIKCIVIDEAHKAQGKHAYCQVVSQLASCSRDFRVLALSATPGTDVKSVQLVIGNLLISHIEIRSEDSIDIQKFSHQRKVEKVVCKLGETMINMKNNFLKVIELFTKSLVNRKALFDRETASYSKYGLLMARDQFRKDPPSGLNKYEIGSVEGDFATCISLFHGLELLQQHGMRSFFIFIKALMEGDKGNMRAKSVLGANTLFRDMYNDLTNMFGNSPNSTVILTQAQQTQQSFKQGNISGQAANYVYSHPKMRKLEEVVLSHFENFVKGHENDATRVMVFCQYRDSVQEITELLQKHRPLVRPMQFVGHSTAAGKATKFTQKDQLMVVSKFRDGGYNTLISTCVGEEGLDIGDVDLIVCFDAHKSPIRLVQRMGRTGRKRKGRIVMLVTEGKEERDYNSSLSNRRSIQKAITGNSGRNLQFYQHNPRLVPKGLDPKPFKLFIKIHEKFHNQVPIKGNKKKNVKKTEMADISVMMKNVEKQNSVFLNYDQVKEWDEKIKLSSKDKEQLKILPFLNNIICLEKTKELKQKSPAKLQPTLSLSEWTLWQTRHQSSNISGHSTLTNNFVEVMEICDLVKQSDEKSFEENYIPFLGGKYDKLKTDINNETKMDSFLIPKGKPRRKEAIKLTEKIKKILEIDNKPSPEFSTDTDFVMEKPKKAVQRDFKNGLAAFAAVEENSATKSTGNIKDDTLIGIESILQDPDSISESSNESKSGSTVSRKSDDVVSFGMEECLPDFDMGGWESDNEVENVVEVDNNEKLFRKIYDPGRNNSVIEGKIEKGIESDNETTKYEKNTDLIDFVNSMSALPTQSPVLPTKNKNPIGNMKPPTPPSFGSISFDFLDDSDHSFLEDDDTKPRSKKRACFDIGDEDNLSKHESENTDDENINDEATGAKKFTPDLKDQTNQYQIQQQQQKTKVSDSRKFDADIAINTNAKTRSETKKCCDKIRLNDPHNTSVDMFDVNFDLGDFDDSFEEENIEDTSSSPVLTSKISPHIQKTSTKLRKYVGDHSRNSSEESHSSLAHITLTQREENQAFFADLPKSLNDFNIPVAEVKPLGSFVEKGSESENEDIVDTNNVSSDEREQFISQKRKRSRNEDSMPSRSKRSKNTSASTLSSPLHWINPANSEMVKTPKSEFTKSTDSDESPIIFRKKGNFKKPIFSPELSQKAIISDGNETTISKNNVTKYNYEESPIPFMNMDKKLLNKNKHSTPKCDYKYFEDDNFSEEDDNISNAVNKKTNQIKVMNPIKKKFRSRQQFRDFVEDEAAVSDDGVNVSSDENESCDLEALEEMKDFVNDATVLTQHTERNDSSIDEHAMYLQDQPDFFEEPAKFKGHNGKFKLAYGVGEGMDVFSQEEPADVSGYEEDSFVCDDIDYTGTDDITALGEVTILEDVTNASSLHKPRLTRRQAELNRLKKLNYDASPALPSVAKLKKRSKTTEKTSRKRIVCMDDSIESVENSRNENDISPQMWECPACTLLNKTSVQICGLCEYQKPDLRVTKAEINNSESWLCEMCTYKNEGTGKKCVMCAELFVSKSMKREIPPICSKTNQKTFNNTSIETTDVDYTSDIISATPAPIQRKSEFRKRLVVASPLTTSATSSSFCFPTPQSSQSSLTSTSVHNEEREDRLRKCKEKQMEYRARMEKRKSFQSSAEVSDKVAVTSNDAKNIIKVTPDRKTRRLMSSIKTSLQFNSPSSTSRSTTDVINSSLSSPIAKETLSKEKAVIFVDSKELSSCQSIITTMRSKHNMHVIVASLPHCDYIIGRGTAVERKMVSDFSQISNRQKLVARFQQLNINYERIYLIIEQDRIKKGDMSGGRPSHSSYYISTVCVLSQTSVRILYSDSQEETAGLLQILSARENKLKRSIDLDVAQKATDIKHRSVLRLYSSIPKVSFTSALYMCQNFSNVKEVASSSVEKLMHKAHLTTCAAAEVYSYFRRNFDLQMTPSR